MAKEYVGTTTVQIFDEKTNELVQEVKEHNIITDCVSELLNVPSFLSMGLDPFNNRAFNPRYNFQQVLDKLFSGVDILSTPIKEDPKLTILPYDVTEVGYAGPKTTDDYFKLGTYNQNESGDIPLGVSWDKSRGFRRVWDFSSDRIGDQECEDTEIHTICLTSLENGFKGNLKGRISRRGTTISDFTNTSNSRDSNSDEQVLLSMYDITNPLLLKNIIPTVLENNGKVEDNSGNCKIFYMEEKNNGDIKLLLQYFGTITPCAVYEIILQNPNTISLLDKDTGGTIKKITKVLDLNEGKTKKITYCHYFPKRDRSGPIGTRAILYDHLADDNWQNEIAIGWNYYSDVTMTDMYFAALKEPTMERFYSCYVANNTMHCFSHVDYRTLRHEQYGLEPNSEGKLPLLSKKDIVLQVGGRHILVSPYSGSVSTETDNNHLKVCSKCYVSSSYYYTKYNTETKKDVNIYYNYFGSSERYMKGNYVYSPFIAMYWDNNYFVYTDEGISIFNENGEYLQSFKPETNGGLVKNVYIDEKQHQAIFFADQSWDNSQYYRYIHSYQVIKNPKTNQYSWAYFACTSPTYVQTVNDSSYAQSHINAPIKVKNVNLPIFVTARLGYVYEKQWVFKISMFYLGKGLITTINTLSTPVTKKKGQTMKITYDITESDYITS